MDFFFDALGVKPNSNIMFSGNSVKTKKLIELMLKKNKNKKNILVLFNPSNYSSLMDDFFIISKYGLGKKAVEVEGFSLSEISSSIHSVQGKKENKGILLFDSLSSLLSFNPSSAVYSFLFFETRKAKEMNYSVVCFIDERLHDNAVLMNIKRMMDYNFFFEIKEKKLFIELTAFPFNSVKKNFVFDL